MINTKKRKWYKTPWKLILIITAPLLTSFFLMMFITNLIEQNTSVRYQTLTARIGLGLIWDGRLPDRSNVIYFDTVENSVRTYAERELHPYSNYINERILEFDENGFHLSVYSGDSMIYFMAPFPRARQVTNISFFLFETDGERYSAPIYFWQHFIESAIGNYRIWYDEDRIARDVIISHFRGDITRRANNDIILFYGVGIGYVPQRLSILGYEPDVIISFLDYNGENNFLWYYYDMSKISDLLETYIDFDAFTLAEIIELLDIQIVR